MDTEPGVSRPTVVLLSAFAAFAFGMLIAIVPLINGEPATRMLRVGIESDALDFIASEFGVVPVAEGEGHDGQYNYLIARDPFGTRGIIELADDPGYRLRRPLLGWASGLFGMARPSAVLLGMAVLTSTGAALAAAALADLSVSLRASRWLLPAALTAVGVWLSVELATTDSLMLGFGLLGIALIVRDRPIGAAAAFTASAFSKEVGLAFAVGTAVWMWKDGRRRGAILVATAPAMALAAWVAWIQRTVGGSLESRDNVGLPFEGIVRAFGRWEGLDGVLAVIALVSMALGFAGLLSRHSIIRWAIIPWLGLAIVSSYVVWAGGNNAARVFSPLWVLGLLGVATSSAAFRRSRSVGVRSFRTNRGPESTRPSEDLPTVEVQEGHKRR